MFNYLNIYSFQKQYLTISSNTQVIPMLNPDGVFLGNQRSDLLGSDLNRCWNRTTSFAHPALVAVNEQIKKLISEKVNF